MVFVLASLVTEMPRNIYPRTRKEITELTAMSWLVRDGTTRENLSPTVEDAVKEMVGMLQWSYDRHQVAAAEYNKQQVKQKATAMQLVNRHNCRINTTKEVKEWWLREPPSPMKFQAMFQLLYCPLGAGNIIMKRVVDEADCNWEQERLSQFMGGVTYSDGTRCNTKKGPRTTTSGGSVGKFVAKTRAELRRQIDTPWAMRDQRCLNQHFNLRYNAPRGPKTKEDKAALGKNHVVYDPAIHVTYKGIPLKDLTGANKKEVDLVFLPHQSQVELVGTYVCSPPNKNTAPPKIVEVLQSATAENEDSDTTSLGSDGDLGASRNLNQDFQNQDCQRRITDLLKKLGEEKRKNASLKKQNKRSEDKKNAIEERARKEQLLEEKTVEVRTRLPGVLLWISIPTTCLLPHTQGDDHENFRACQEKQPEEPSRKEEQPEEHPSRKEKQTKEHPSRKERQPRIHQLGIGHHHLERNSWTQTERGSFASLERRGEGEVDRSVGRSNFGKG